MREPYLSQFRALVEAGAVARDIHDVPNAVGYAAKPTQFTAAYIEREINRVEAHQRSLVPLLERYVGPVSSILDVGCSSGGTTVALALSTALGAARVIAVDPNAEALAAARVRTEAYGLDSRRVLYRTIRPGEPLPFESGMFGLTVCVSVLEFITAAEARAALASELERVTAVGGFIFISTPSVGVREYHSKRFLGDFRRRTGYPWSSSRWQIQRMFRTCEPVDIRRHSAADLARHFGLPDLRLPSFVARSLVQLMPWQKLLFRKHPGCDGDSLPQAGG